MKSRKQAMISALRGEVDQGLLFVPRLDIWFLSNQYCHTLPLEWQQSGLNEIVQQLGCVYNKYLPDYAQEYSLSAVEHRLLGFYNSQDIPYRIHLDSSIQTTRTCSEDGQISVVYRTPAGDLKGSFVMDEALKQQGSTLPPIAEHLVKSEADYKPLLELLSAIRVTPAPENYRALCARVGEQGHPAVFGHLAASPVQALLRDFFDPTFFFLEYKTNLSALLELAKPLERLLLEIAHCVVECAAEPMVLWGGNYDSMLTFPPLFQSHILPFLNQVAELVHGREGRLISHCDGDNRLLLGLFAQSGIDVLQSVNVSPMVPNTYREIREGLCTDQVVSGGVPATVLVKSMTSDAGFAQFLEALRRDYPKGERLILEVSDNVTPDADLGRLRALMDISATL